MDIYYLFIFLPNEDRKHYYIKVVESIQFVWTGNSGISRDLCNADTYRSINEGLLFNSSSALDLKLLLVNLGFDGGYPKGYRARLPYC
jgi:hypothetical protein